MELQDAVKIVKAGNLKSRSLFELWEVEQVLRDSGDTENLAAFQKEFSPKDMEAADAAAKTEIEKRQAKLAAVKEAYTEDETFKKGMDNFWNGIEVTNDKDSDKVNAEELRRQIEEVSAKEAEKEILEGRVKPEDYKTLLQNIMSANCIQLVSVSAVSEMVSKGKKLTGAAAKSKATKLFTSLFSAERKEKVQISGKAAVGFLASKMNSLSKFAKRLADHTGLTAFAKEVKKVDEKLTKAYPNTYPLGKSLAKTSAISVLFGGVGIAVYSTYRLGQTIQQQRMAAEKEEKSYWDYLKSNKEQFAVLGAGVVSSALSLAGMSLDNMGLTSNLLNANAAKDVADAGVATAASSGFSWSGAWEGIKNNFTNGKYLLRTGAATAASIAVASKEYSKLYGLNPDSPEYKAQRSKARRVLTGSALGTLIGLTAAAAVGGMHGAEVQVASTETGTSVQPETETKVQPETETKVQPETETKVQPETETKVQPETGTKVQPGTGTPVQPETETGTGNGTEVVVSAHDFSTTENVQKFYEHRVSNINEYHKLVADRLPDQLHENGLTGQQVVDQMLGRAQVEEWVKLPEGCTPEHAVHTAVMAAQYRGDFELAKMLNCPGDYTPEQIERAFAAKLPLYNSESGRAGGIGYPTDIPYNPHVPFGGSSHLDDCHDMHNSRIRIGGVIPEKIVVEETTTVTTTTGQPVETWVDQTTTTYENLQYDASFQAAEYQPETETSSKLVYLTYGKDNIQAGQPGVEDIYVARNGERVEVSGPDDLQKGDKLVIKYAHGEETVPAKKYAGFETTEIAHDYESYTSDQVAAEAKELGVEPGVLTKLENGDYVKVTSDGVVRIDADAATGKASVVLTDFDGKPMNAPTEVQERVVNETVTELNETNQDKEVVKTEKVKVVSGSGTDKTTQTTNRTTVSTIGQAAKQRMVTR